MSGSVFVSLSPGGAGRLLALHLAERGYDLALMCAEAPEMADAVAEEARAEGRRTAVLWADLGDPAGAVTVMGQAADALGGPLGVLVNDATGLRADVAGPAFFEGWDREVSRMLRLPVVLARAFAAQVPSPVPDRAGEPCPCGLVVNLVDRRALRPGTGYLAASVAGGAILDFSRRAALEMAPATRVNAIGVDLGGGGREAPGEWPDPLSLSHGMGQDLARALDFLLEASAVTGQSLWVGTGPDTTESAPGGAAPD